jgi:hypothetical protein
LLSLLLPYSVVSSALSGRPTAASMEQSRVVEQLNPAELAVVLGTREVAARSMAEQEGVLRDPPTVLDATHRQLRAVAAVWAVLSRWHCSLDLDKRLGDQLKMLPAQDVQVINEFPRSGALLS